MNVEHYRNFVKIVDRGTISSAARELLIAQPTLSKQIKLLEAELGTPLLKRGSRKIELTNAGQIFYEKAKLICSLEETVFNEVKATILGNRGTLRLGLTASYPDPFSEDLLRDFSFLHPYVNYEIYEASSIEIMDMLKNNIIEVGLIRTPPHINPIFKSYKAIEEQLMAVFHKDNPWLSPELDVIPIMMLKNVPLSISRGFNKKILEIFSDAGFLPILLSICSSRPTTLMWARQLRAVGIVTVTSPLALETDMLCCRPLTGGDMSTKRSFAILKERSLSTVAQSFLNFVTAEADF